VITSEVVLQAQDITKSFDGNTVLTSIDMNIHPGLTLITGPSGSGKTTMLNVLAGIEKPDNGIVSEGGLDVYSMSKDEISEWRAQNGYCFQNPSLLGGLTIMENVIYPAQLSGVPLENDHVEELFESLEINKFRSSSLLGLSGGQKQRVALARALVTKPRMIFADEPTAALDTESKLEIQELIKKASLNVGAAVVMVTHDLVPNNYADFSYRLVDGKNVTEKEIL